MKEKGMTQAELASAVGVYQSYISKLIRGEQTRLGADVLFKICDALGVSCDHFRPLLAGDEPPPDPTPAGGKAAKPKGKRGKKS